MTSLTSESKVKTAPVLGVGVSLMSMDETLATLEKLVSCGGSHQLVTADASGFAIAEDDDDLRRIYESADIVTPDSQGVIWALGRSGQKGITRVSGVELVGKICELSANKGYRVYLLGAAPGIAETAAEKLRLMYPGCNIVGTRHGYFPADDDEIVAQEIKPFEPDFLFVAMGIPRQEKFIDKTKNVIQAKVAIGVGGSLDVFSGSVKRAPVLVQKAKLEWVWRLLLNPSKFGKVKMLPKFVRLVLGSKP